MKYKAKGVIDFVFDGHDVIMRRRYFTIAEEVNAANAATEPTTEPATTAAAE